MYKTWWFPSKFQNIYSGSIAQGGDLSVWPAASTNIWEEQRKHAFLMSVNVFVCVCVCVCVCVRERERVAMEVLQGKNVEPSSNLDPRATYENTKVCELRCLYQWSA